MMTLALLASLTLSWDANTDDTTGYFIYAGPSSGRYTRRTDVGNVVSYVVPTEWLIPGEPIYFAASAYDDIGLESDFSNEVSYTPPGPVRPVIEVTLSGGLVTLSFKTESDHLYTVWYKDDDQSPWDSLVTIPGDGNWAHYTEVADKPKRIYRVEAIR